MNTLSVRDLCCLFCCPPFPSRIAAKLGKYLMFIDIEKYLSELFIQAFLPPEPTYSLHVVDLLPSNNETPNDKLSTSKKSPTDTNASVRYTIKFSDKAEWQHSSTDLTKLEPYFVTTSRRNRIACFYVNCTPNPKYHLLFSHGNAVDLGKSIFIDRSFEYFSFQDKWPVFFLFWVHVYSVIL